MVVETGLDGRVLGKLLLLQSVFASLPDAAILPFLVQGLSGIAEIGNVEFHPKAEIADGSRLRFPLTSRTGNYGELIFHPANPEGFAPYADHVRNFLFMAVLVLDERKQRRMIEIYQHSLEDQVAERTKELALRNRQLVAAQTATITAFSVLAEARDNETGNHIHRTKNYVRALAEALRSHPRFCHVLNDETIQLFSKSAPLHDVGKVAIPDAVLLKPGKLNAEEWTIMKLHCVVGRDAIIASARDLGEGDDAFLRCAAEIAYCHHERWNGSGYPSGMAGDAIPLSARLMAVADVYDALTSRRVYKEPFSHALSVETMSAERGEHFDPDILDAMLSIAGEFEAIATRFHDNVTV